jgi:5-methylcytosine-specific restriction endonuclease McrA
MCNAYLPGKGELHVHHRKPVAKSLALALDPANFQVLCPECHNIVEPRTGSRMSACDDELGRPLDPEHPWFRD